MKKILALMLVLITVVSLCACGKKSADADPIVGEWNLVAMESQGMKFTTEDISSLGLDITVKFVFKDDGTFTGEISGYEGTGNGKWTNDGSKYTLEISGKEQTAEIKDGQLVLDIEGSIMYLEQ